MAIFTEKTRTRIDCCIDENFCTLSILLEPIVYKDGEEYSRGESRRRAFTPGQFQEVLDWVGSAAGAEKIQALLKMLWTQDVIDKHNANIEQQQ